MKRYITAKVQIYFDYVWYHPTVNPFNAKVPELHH